MGKVWDKYLDPQDRQIYSKAGFGQRYGLGQKPALVIVDVQYGFTGDKPEPVEESIKKYPSSCGSASWDSVPYIQRLLDVVRNVGLPVYYTIIEGSRGCSNDKVAVKGNIFDHPRLLEGEKGTRVVAELKPLAGEIVISKKKPSAFFGTPFISYLIKQNVDSLIVTGCTTSGCVRATVIDAFSNNFQVIVPQECVFDRGVTSHAINLFDMQQKYADVMPTADVINMLTDLKLNDLIAGEME